MKYGLRAIPLLLALASTVCADGPDGSITGVVNDTENLPISNARVLIVNRDTAIARTTQTNERGRYQFPGLQPGVYRIEISAVGLSSLQKTGLEVRVGEQLRLDVSLPPFEVRTQVSFQPSTPAVSADGSGASTVVSGNAIQELPSNGRQLQNLVLLVPGASAGWNLSTAANRNGRAREGTEGAFSINGARSRSNSFVLDGMPLNLRQFNAINFEPSNEAVQEFEVKTLAPAAEFGRTMGGIINIVTRGGSAQYHGSLYEFFRNDKLDANNTFNNRTGLPRGEVRHNQFGGTFGGPLARYRHFFFVGTELLRNIETSETRLTSVPTDEERRGLLTWQDSSENDHKLDLSNRMTPLSRKLLALYPKPNVSDLGSLNYNAPLAIKLNDYQYHLRTDHHFSDRDVVTLRTSWNLNDRVFIINRFGGPYIPGFSLVNPERTTNGTLGHLHNFGSSIVNEARMGVSRFGNLLGNGDHRKAADFGFPNGTKANGIPTVSFSAGTLEQLGGPPGNNREQNELALFFSDSVTVLHGSHSLKVGAELSRFQYNTRGASNERGTVLFDGSRNEVLPRRFGNPRASVLADLILGLPQQATITVGQFGRGYRQWAYAAYMQDSWRMSRRLTINYGVRYEYNTPWTEVNGKLSNFVPGVGLITPQSPDWHGLYAPDWNNFAPRAGFAWDVNGRGHTIVRGGFAMLYETLMQSSTVQPIENNPPFSGTAVTYVPTPFPLNGSPATTLLDLRNSAEPSRNLAAIPYGLHTPYSLQYAIGVQQSVGRAWLVDIGYRATRGIKLPLNYNINQVPIELLTPDQRLEIRRAVGSAEGTQPVLDAFRPYGDYNMINLYDNTASSIYHALQARVEHRFAQGLDLLTSYTWSKSIDNSSDFSSGDSSERVLNSYNLRSQRGLSSFDIPHRFTLAAVYRVPDAQRARWLFSGWQLNANVTMQSGQPFTPYTTTFDPYRNESFNRLDVVGDPNAKVPGGRAYNPAAFRTPPQGKFGNSGRNIIRGSRYRSIDASIFRNIVVKEGMRLQLRLEALNSMNNVNYEGPVTNQASSAPGAWVAAAPPRLLQLGMKLSF